MSFSETMIQAMKEEMAESIDWQAQRIEDLELLVRWLANTYGDNAPIFATCLPDGRPLETGQMLSDLYREIMGEKRGLVGAWFTCPECGVMQIHSNPQSEL